MDYIRIPNRQPEQTFFSELASLTDDLDKKKFNKRYNAVCAVLALEPPMELSKECITPIVEKLELCLYVQELAPRDLPRTLVPRLVLDRLGKVMGYG